jgi:hypothetical protein
MCTFEHLRTPAVVPVVDDYLQLHKLADGAGFPPSYTAFAKQLGWERLCGLLLVYMPQGQHPDSWLVQSPRIKQLIDDFYEEMEPDGYEGIERSLVPFGMSENGEYLAWDISQRTADGELPIYVMASRMGGIRYGAENLYQLVEKCTNDTAVKAMFGPGYKAFPAVFEPLALAT